MQYDYLEAWLALREPTGPPPEKLAGAWEACRSHLSPSSAAAGNLQWRKRWEEMAETLAVLVAAGGQVIPGGVEALARVADHHLQVPPSLSMRPVGEWRLEVTAEGIEVLPA